MVGSGTYRVRANNYLQQHDFNIHDDNYQSPAREPEDYPIRRLHTCGVHRSKIIPNLEAHPRLAVHILVAFLKELQSWFRSSGVLRSKTTPNLPVLSSRYFLPTPWTGRPLPAVHHFWRVLCRLPNSKD